MINVTLKEKPSNGAMVAYAIVQRIKDADGTAMNISELQQMWQSDIGEEKWEVVPFVD